jgi:hypothetical protein
VEPEAAGEQGVGHHVLKDIAFPHARHVHAPGQLIGPTVDIALGVKNDRRPAGCTR